MDSYKTHSKLDRLGMTASILCAIHCAIVPIVFTSLPLLGLGFLTKPWIEWGMIILAIFIGSYTLLSSYFSHHHRFLPVIIFLSGFAILLAGHTFLHGWLEGVVVPIGGLTIAGSHFVNHKFMGECSREGNMFKHKHNMPAKK